MIAEKWKFEAGLKQPEGAKKPQRRRGLGLRGGLADRVGLACEPRVEEHIALTIVWQNKHSRKRTSEKTRSQTLADADADDRTVLPDVPSESQQPLNFALISSLAGSPTPC